MTFNPNAPETIGLEWFPTVESSVLLDTATSVVPVRVVSSGAETIDQLQVAHKYSSPGSTGYARHWVDVYDAATSYAPGISGVTELRYAPNEDKAKSTYTTQSDGVTTTNLYQQVDDADDTVDPHADYVVNSAGGLAGEYFAVQFATAAIANTYRIAYVRFEVRAKGFATSAFPPAIYLDVYNNATLVGRLPGSTIAPPMDYVFRTYNIGPYYFDPYNEGPWLQPEIVLWDNNTSRNVRVVIDYAAAVTRLTMVVGVITENRLAVGIGTKVTVAPSGTVTNNALMLKTPLGVDNWSKPASGTAVAVVRRLDDPLGVATTLATQIVTLDSGAANPHGQGLVMASATMADQSGILSATGTTGTKAASVVLGTSGSAQSADSQPYHDLEPKACHTTSDLRQGINAATGTPAYKRVRFLAAVAASVTPSASMSVKVRRTSDNVQMGGTGTLAVADLTDSAIATSKGSIVFGATTYTVYDVVVTLASTATLAAATNYYIELTSTAAAVTPWYVIWLDATPTHALTGNITYGGTTNAAYVAGATTTTADFPGTFGSVPSAPGGLTAVLTSTAAGAALYDAVTVDWTSTTLAGSFTRYEVQRSIDGGTVYTAIATIAVEATSVFVDHEAPRQTATKYRVRVVRSDAAASDWTTLSGTVTPTQTGGYLVFTSNNTPSIKTAYVVHGTETTYGFVSGDRHVRVEAHDRDYALVFKPTEDRGVTWPFTLQIHTNHLADPSAGAGVRAFTAIRAISEADVPYVCVHTFDGERLFGSLAVKTGTRIEPNRGYLAHCELTQTQSESTVVAG